MNDQYCVQVSNLASTIDAEITNYQNQLSVANTQITTLNNTATSLQTRLTNALAAGTAVVTTVNDWNMIDGMEYCADFIQDGNSGNNGGASALPHGSYILSHVGTGLQFNISPVHLVGNSDNFYLYRTAVSSSIASNLLASLSTATKVRYGFEGCFASSSAMLGSQAVEWEVQLNPTGNKIINLAFQYDRLGTKKVRVFNYTNPSWIATKIAVDPNLFAPGVFASIEGQFTIDQTKNTVTHDALVINGVQNAVGITQNATTGTATSHRLNCAFQLDSNNASPVPTPHGFNIRKWHVMWR